MQTWEKARYLVVLLTKLSAYKICLNSVVSVHFGDDVFIYKTVFVTKMWTFWIQIPVHMIISAQVFVLQC